MSENMKIHHHYTDPGEDYVRFEVRCDTCGMLLFEFVHKQKLDVYDSRLMAIPAPNPPMSAASWYKPLVRVICHGRERHAFMKALDGEDRNQVVCSRSMTRAQFDEWNKETAPGEI